MVAVFYLVLQSCCTYLSLSSLMAQLIFTAQAFLGACILFACTSFEEPPKSIVCDCVAANFHRIDINYTLLLQELEADLVLNKIIDREDSSRLAQIRAVSQTGRIENIRTFEDLNFERMNFRTIKYCSDLHAEDIGLEFYRMLTSMFYRMERLEINSLEGNGIEEYRKNTAKILLENTSDLEADSALFRLIQLNFLYRTSDTQQLRSMLDSERRIAAKKAASDALVILPDDIVVKVASDDMLSVNGETVSLEELCPILSSHFNRDERVIFSSDRNTNYKYYVKVHLEIQDCYKAAWERKSLEVFDDSYINLSDEEKDLIKEFVPFNMVEKMP